MGSQLNVDIKQLPFNAVDRVGQGVWCISRFFDERLVGDTDVFDFLLCLRVKLLGKDPLFPSDDIDVPHLFLPIRLEIYLELGPEETTQLFLCLHYFVPGHCSPGRTPNQDVGAKPPLDCVIYIFRLLL